ncbi:MAG TPA: glycoside hydrolase family 2 protein, partial [Terracidiphilus sp.]
MRRAVAWGVLCCAGLAAMFFSNAALAQSANAALVLDHGWQFRQSPAAGEASDGGWLPATVPGDVHLDLLANKRIPDPFFRGNEAKLQWIDEASWEYQLSFDVPAAMAGRANVDLVFDGLDAAAEVYLNDAKVLDADNMFRVWRVPVKANLHAGKNVLRVVFPSPITAAEKVAATDPWQPKTKTAAKTYIRKAAYEY